MGLTATEKIIAGRLVSGELKPGEEIGLSVDQTLTQDATGTLVYLEFEALGLDRIKTRLSVSYVDHNTLQTGFENADDHRFLQSFAARYGLYFSKAGNGICHQVHLERFGRPGEVLLGSDSHTPTAGGLGMLSFGVGGLEIASVLAGEPYFLRMPEVFKIRLEGALPRWVSAKDVILYLLQNLSVRGGVGKILEYSGSGVGKLTVPERATIANMGAETGATTSVFPADEQTRAFLKARGREKDFTELRADDDAGYPDELVVELSSLEPLVACPHSPDNVKPVTELAGTKVDQVCIGSCTNSSLRDLMTAAAVLRGRTVHPEVSLVVSPGSRQVLDLLAQNGGLADLISAGARILENACGPCIGMGQAPPTGGVSLRTYNRNFQGRSGTRDAGVYLVSPETAAAAALAGAIVDPRELGSPPEIALPESYPADNSLILEPAPGREKVAVLKGPNISSIPLGDPLPKTLRASVWLKLGSDVTTDEIMPAGAEVLPLRSNIEKISQYVFRDATRARFARYARAERGKGRWGVIVAGDNYGQGSSREHAALAPRHLGVRAVLARSFARIHRANLINFGILPLTLQSEDRDNAPDRGESVEFPELRREVEAGGTVTLRNLSRHAREIQLELPLTERERKSLLAGGRLNLLKKRG